MELPLWKAGQNDIINKLNNGELTENDAKIFLKMDKLMLLEK